MEKMQAEVAAKPCWAGCGDIPVARARELVRKTAIETDAVRMADSQEPTSAICGHLDRGAIDWTTSRNLERYASGPNPSMARRPAVPSWRRKAADAIKRCSE